MRHSRSLIPLLVLSTLFGSSCQSLGLGESTLTSTPSVTVSPTISPTSTITRTPTITPTPTDLPSIPEPDPPESQSSTVFGRLLWRGRPAGGVRVHMVGTMSDGERGSFDVVTNGDGLFLFEDIPSPELYYLLYALPGSPPDWMEGLPIASGSIHVESTPGENFSVGDFVLIDNSLGLIEPQREAAIRGDFPHLRWESYPGADYYQVTLDQEYGDFSDLEVETTDTELSLEGPLLECLYGWNVSAFAADGTLLARSDVYADQEEEFLAEHDGLFQFEGDELPPCQMDLAKPQPYQTFSVVSGMWEIEWELIPWAVSYQVVLHWVQDGQGRYVGENVPTTRVAVDENGQPEAMNLPTLSPGIYEVYIVAYAEDGSILAQTEKRPFRIQ